MIKFPRFMVSIVVWLRNIAATLFSTEVFNEFLRVIILVALIGILIFPVYLMSYMILFTDLISADSWRTELLYYYGRTDSHDKIWGIFAPLLVSISVGVNFTNAISTRTVILFLFFLMSYIVADIGAVTLETEKDLQEVLKARKGVDIEKLQIYFTSIGTMCITAIATVLGLSVSKLGR